MQQMYHHFGATSVSPHAWEVNVCASNCYTAACICNLRFRLNFSSFSISLHCDGRSLSMSQERPHPVRHMSNNEANQITRESICTALLFLMDEKEFDQITISELVRKAGVSRQSFYRNYKSKEDIIIEIEETILTTFAASLNNPKYVNNYRLWLYDFFELIKENHSVIAVLHKANLSDVLFEKVPFLVEDYAHKHSKEVHYYIIGMLGALKSIVLHWFFSGMKESCETMVDICLQFDFEKIIPIV